MLGESKKEKGLQSREQGSGIAKKTTLCQPTWIHLHGKIKLSHSVIRARLGWLGWFIWLQRGFNFVFIKMLAVLLPAETVKSENNIYLRSSSSCSNKDLKKKESQSSHKTQQSGKAARYCQQNLRVIWYKHWARNGTLFPSSHLRILIMGLFHTPENKAGAGNLFQQLSAKPGLLPLPWKRDLSGSLRIRELVCWQGTSGLRIFNLDFCSEKTGK